LWSCGTVSCETIEASASRGMGQKMGRAEGPVLDSP
jgi:hypothetical protein